MAKTHSDITLLCILHTTQQKYVKSDKNIIQICMQICEWFGVVKGLSVVLRKSKTRYESEGEGGWEKFCC